MARLHEWPPAAGGSSGSSGGGSSGQWGRVEGGLEAVNTVVRAVKYLQIVYGSSSEE
jgi:hypothetical protein